MKLPIYCTEIFILDGIAGSQREYIQWLLTVCSAQEEGDTAILTEEALDLLATKLRMPLQVQQHITWPLKRAILLENAPSLPSLLTAYCHVNLMTWSQHLRVMTIV